MSESGEVTPREITKANWDVLRLKAAQQQEQFVASNAGSLAEAHLEPEIPWFRAVYAGEVPVGFLMLEYDPEGKTHNSWRSVIGVQHREDALDEGVALTRMQVVRRVVQQRKDEQ